MGSDEGQIGSAFMNNLFSEQIKSLAKRYLETEMDSVTVQQISQDIETIQTISDRIFDGEDMKPLYGLLSTITSHLYVARGFVSSTIPRNHEFYKHIQECQAIFRQIIMILE